LKFQHFEIKLLTSKNNFSAWHSIRMGDKYAMILSMLFKEEPP